MATKPQSIRPSTDEETATRRMICGGYSVRILWKASVLIKSRTHSHCTAISSYSKPRTNVAPRLLKLPSTWFPSSVIFMSSTSAAAGISTASFDGTRFQLSPSSVLKIEKGDITQWFVDGSSDAIVNPANERMLGGGGADGAIHRAAGPELKEACYKVPEVQPGVRCPTGEARITPGFKLPVSHVIHTVGPIYYVDPNPKASLTSTYRNSLVVAKDNKIQYVAFPAISCGVYGYPYEEAASVAISALKEYADGIKEVHFVLFLDDIYEAWLKAAKELLEV